MPKAKFGEGRRKGKFDKGRRPHNARSGEEFADLPELVRKLASEKKRVTINGEQLEMSWAERSFRLTIDRALAGNRRDLAQMLRLMIRHPSVANTEHIRVQYFFRGALCDV